MKLIVTQLYIKRQAFLVGAVSVMLSSAASAQTEAPPAESAPAAETETDSAAAPAPETAAPETAPATAPTPDELTPAPAAEPAPTPVTASIAVSEEESSEPVAEKSDDPVGINVDVGIASIYNFRGLNTFMEETQQDQNALFAPSVTWSIFDTGLSLGYWGAYQITGDNKKEMVDTALGHEQDIFIGYELGLADDLLALNFAFTYFFYPFADDDIDGVPTNPSIIEPLVGISVATVLDIGFTASYFHGLQDDLKAVRHAYFNLSFGKGFEFNDTFGMNLGAALGIKAWVEDNDDNQFDLAFDWSIPISLTDQLYLEPGIHLAWTDFEDVEDDESTDDVDESVKMTAGDEFMVYWSINVGADF